MGPRREFAKRFAEGIEKLAGNIPGDRRKRTIRLILGMSKAIGLAGWVASVPPQPRILSGCQWLNRLSWAAESPVSQILGTFGG
ncbi:hypothetical protein BHE74_00011171 [Ensete ventricosum]|nr:hypothetical protein GW17_00009260 [Ensete ventricosum]RWW80491.1 hypothetical protein BHE74_00011171 [Ensete ventricosum]RZR86103.1 hypothetical protein BHM03_00013213 [Ensete ventricosum]